MRSAAEGNRNRERNNDPRTSPGKCTSHSIPDASRGLMKVTHKLRLAHPWLKKIPCTSSKLNRRLLAADPAEPPFPIPWFLAQQESAVCRWSSSLEKTKVSRSEEHTS